MDQNFRPGLQSIRRYFHTKKYRIYSRPYELNIVGIRSENTRPNRFDDLLCLFYKDQQHNWRFFLFPATTDPGTFWLNNPMQEQGTAILIEGQYTDTYQIGMHRGKYMAMVQRLKPVSVWRDYNRDAVLDFNNGNIHFGYFGINIHHASNYGTTKVVEKYSGGCQVFANIEDFNFFMSLCEQHRELYGNSFTYTLIDLRALKRRKRRMLVYTTTGAAVTLAGIYALWKQHEKKQYNQIQKE